MLNDSAPIVSLVGCFSAADPVAGFSASLALNEKPDLLAGVAVLAGGVLAGSADFAGPIGISTSSARARVSPEVDAFVLLADSGGLLKTCNVDSSQDDIVEPAPVEAQPLWSEMTIPAAIATIPTRDRRDFRILLPRKIALLFAYCLTTNLNRAQP